MPFTAWKPTERNRQRDRKNYCMFLTRIKPKRFTLNTLFSRYLKENLKATIGPESGDPYLSVKTVTGSKISFFFKVGSETRESGNFWLNQRFHENSFA